uniref:Uncharacterized protein n=1 Tax=viral metagenome TaxID=1070528 RepID=A0A6M3LBY8_9ZZZZ
MKTTMTDTTITITLPRIPPRRSSTGKSELIGTTGGYVATDLDVDGKLVKASVNVIIK